MYDSPVPMTVPVLIMDMGVDMDIGVDLYVIATDIPPLALRIRFTV